MVVIVIDIVIRPRKITVVSVPKTDDIRLLFESRISFTYMNLEEVLVEVINNGSRKTLVVVNVPVHVA